MQATVEENHNAPPGASGNARPQILQDFNSKGRNRPWAVRKRQGIAVADAFRELGGQGAKTYERMLKCGSILQFETLRHVESGTTRKRLDSATFCKHRLCPCCQWRRSVLLHGQLCEAVKEHLDDCPEDRALMLTLTMRNCPAHDLSAAVTRMTTAFRRMSDTAGFKRAVKGFFRSVEVTRRAEDGTYHPHMHVLLVVPPEYFDKGHDLYRSTAEWVQAWRKALRVGYDPICDARAVGGRHRGFTPAVRKGLVEVTKYCTKPADWLEFVGGRAATWRADPQVVAELAAGLKSKRLVGWGGVLRDIYEELEFENVEDDNADLVGRRKPIPEGWVSEGFETYNYRGRRLDTPGNYYLMRWQPPDADGATGPPRYH